MNADFGLLQPIESVTCPRDIHVTSSNATKASCLASMGKTKGLISLYLRLCPTSEVFKMKIMTCFIMILPTKDSVTVVTIRGFVTFHA